MNVRNEEYNKVERDKLKKRGQSKQAHHLDLIAQAHSGAFWRMGAVNSIIKP
jgi:hypothetical protein